MAYEKKIRSVDAPVGVMRLAGRDQQDMRTAAAVPSATGGAPSTVGAAEGLRRELAAPSPIERTPPVFRMTPSPRTDELRRRQEDIRYQIPAEPQPILPTLSRRPMHSPDRYAGADPTMLKHTEDYVRGLMDDGHEFPGFVDASEVAKYMQAAIYSAYEPHMEEPMPLADLVHQTARGREIAGFIQRSITNQRQFRGRAL